MNVSNVSINITKEKRTLYNIIKRYGLSENGIIYGGMVRDEIVATHFKELYDSYVVENKIYNSYKDKYWDPTFHPESNKRLIIPNDMDIYFDDKNKAKSFINHLNTYSNDFNGNVRVRNVSRTNSVFYTIGQNINHKKIKITFKLGRTFVFSGIKIEANIDLIINNSDFSRSIEPPFNNGDFTSNLFVIVKSYSERYDIRLSKNTGTKLDEMNYVSKKRAEMNIINDLVNGKTEFIKNSNDISSEYINGMRILKMINRNYPIAITNLLFREIDSIDEIKNDGDCCDICQSSIRCDYEKDSKIVEINTNKFSKNYMHRICFIQYLEKEIFAKRINDTTNCIECRCTRRNPFNFKESYKFSSLYK